MKKKSLLAFSPERHFFSYLLGRKIGWN